METPTHRIPSDYSAEERTALLQLARESIAAELAKSRLSVTAPNPHLLEPRGAFTTLHLNGGLRGCIGFIEPLYPLWETIQQTSRAAAFQDPRFPPLTADELPYMQLELSIMSLLRPISAEDVIVGVHGLLVSQDGHRGLLLPQVAPEWEWDRETFLSQTCVKAGLPPDAWQKGAQLEAFTAEVFGEINSFRNSI
jgi:AmmeMemoRadiSam system protein A